MDGLQGYRIVSNTLANDTIHWPASGCNYIEFINNGNGIVYVNQTKILPYGSWAPAPPLRGEADYTQYNLRWETATEYNLVCHRKYYINAVQ